MNELHGERLRLIHLSHELIIIIATRLCTHRSAWTDAAITSSPLGELAGLDTTSFDELFISFLRVGLPVWGACVSVLFVFGTIAKVAFPEKYDKTFYDADKKVEKLDDAFDFSNLSPEDFASVSALEAEEKS